MSLSVSVLWTGIFLVISALFGIILQYFLKRYYYRMDLASPDLTHKPETPLKVDVLQASLVSSLVEASRAYQRLSEVKSLLQHGTINGEDVAFQPHFRDVASFWLEPTFDGYIMALECQTWLRRDLGEETALDARERARLLAALKTHWDAESGGGLFARDSWPSLYGLQWWVTGARILAGTRLRESDNETKAILAAFENDSVKVEKCHQFIKSCSWWNIHKEYIGFVEEPTDKVESLIGAISSNGAYRLSLQFAIPAADLLPPEYVARISDPERALRNSLANFAANTYRELPPSDSYGECGGFSNNPLNIGREDDVAIPPTIQMIELLMYSGAWRLLDEKRLQKIIVCLLESHNSRTGGFAIRRFGAAANVVSTRQVVTALRAIRKQKCVPAGLEEKVDAALRPESLWKFLESQRMETNDFGFELGSWPNLWCMRNAVQLLDYIWDFRGNRLTTEQQVVARRLLDRMKAYQDDASGLCSVYLPVSAAGRVAASDRAEDLVAAERSAG